MMPQNVVYELLRNRESLPARPVWPVWPARRYMSTALRRGFSRWGWIVRSATVERVACWRWERALAIPARAFERSPPAGVDLIDEAHS